MDKNGYSDFSLFNTKEGICWYCHMKADTARHEAFFGTRNRSISKATGLWLYLCPRCHSWVHGGVHISRELTLDQYIKNKAEVLFRRTYRANFRNTFYGALKNWELDDLKQEVKDLERKQSR